MLLTTKVSWRFLAAVSFFILPSIFAVATMKEFWPFSPYPMFSKFDSRRTMGVLRLRATTGSGKDVWLSGYRDLFPLGPQCINRLGRLLRPGFEQDLKLALDFYQRKATETSGEPIESIQLELTSYRFDESWTLVNSAKRTIYSRANHD